VVQVGRGGTKQQSLSPNHYTGQQRVRRSQGRKKPGNCYQQSAKHQNPGDAEAAMTSIIFIENTQGFVMMAGLSLGGKSTNSTFNLNFQLKFLKFRKWNLDNYEIIKVLKIH
jgi:hypothetical protein